MAELMKDASNEELEEIDNEIGKIFSKPMEAIIDKANKLAKEKNNIKPISSWHWFLFMYWIVWNRNLKTRSNVQKTIA